MQWLLQFGFIPLSHASLPSMEMSTQWRRQTTLILKQFYENTLKVYERDLQETTEHSLRTADTELFGREGWSETRRAIRRRLQVTQVEEWWRLELRRCQCEWGVGYWRQKKKNSTNEPLVLVWYFSVTPSKLTTSWRPGSTLRYLPS